jgi:hypothetical protein
MVKKKFHNKKKKKIKKKQNQKANILQIPSGTLGSIAVPTIVLGQLENILIYSLGVLLCCWD